MPKLYFRSSFKTPHYFLIRLQVATRSNCKSNLHMLPEYTTKTKYLSLIHKYVPISPALPVNKLTTNSHLNSSGLLHLHLWTKLVRFFLPLRKVDMFATCSQIIGYFTTSTIYTNINYWLLLDYSSRSPVD